MQVSRWGNSLAIRVPAKIVRQLDLREGDEVELERGPGPGNALQLSKRLTVEDALDGIKRMQKPLPEGWRFNREEIYGDDRGE
jgi:antitoxin MazE